MTHQRPYTDEERAAWPYGQPPALPDGISNGFPEQRPREDMSEWMPIETAPVSNVVNGMGRSDPFLLTNGEDIWSAVRVTYAGDSYFQCHGASGYECEDDFYNPTHWMPLPALPPSGKL